MEIYDSKYLKLKIDNENSILETHWKKPTSNMDEEDYKNEVEQIIKSCEKYNSKYILSDSSNFLFAIAPEVQDWIELNVTPKVIKFGLKKMAFAVSQELISQISIEQMMEEGDTQQIKSAYFKNMEVAKNWLLKK